LSRSESDSKILNMKFKVSKKVFAHIDCDSFFVACEVLRNPILAKKDVCVGSDITVAASYSAKKKWIKVGTPFWEAKKILWKKFVGLVPDMSLYGKVSKKLMRYLSGESDLVEVFSIDEALIELTWIPESQGKTLEVYVHDLQKQILQHIWVPVSIWVSNTRLRAKIFSKARKPYGYFLWMDNESVYNQFQDMPVSDIPFIGYSSQKKLAAHIYSIYDFSREGMFYYRELIWKIWMQVWLEVNGVNSMSFAKKPWQKSISKTRSFPHQKTWDFHRLWTMLLRNLERLYSEMYTWEYELRNFSIHIVSQQGEYFSQKYFFPDYTCDSKKISSLAYTLLWELFQSGTVYKKTWVSTSDIQKHFPRQMSIFSGHNKKHEKDIQLENILWEIHKKYGTKSIHMWC